MSAASWPLTGRAGQLESLGRDYRDGLVGGVIVHGPAGVGKTRLAEEALGRAERSGRPVARAVGHPSTVPIPLGALAHLLPESLIPDLGVGDDERTGLFHLARAGLRRLAGDQRLVLLVDDVDLLDDTSVAVLVPLVVSRTVFLLGTVRTGRSPSQHLTGLQRDGHLGRLDLAPLGSDELGALLHRALDRPVASGALGELVRASEGNLQVLTELVRGARDRGVLIDDGAAWQLVGSLPTTVALEELVAEHLADVDEVGLAVLELLAVCERVGLVDLERLYGLATLEALEAGRLISVVTSGRRTAVRLAHPLYGEVLRARLAPLRLRRINQQLADLVEGCGARRREDVVQVALWRLASGGQVSGAQLLRAARLALAGHNPTLALRVMAAWSDDDAIAFERAEVLAEAHDMLGQHVEVERVVADTLAGALTDAQRSQLARRLAGTRFYARRDLDGALAALDDVGSMLTDPAEVLAVEARRAGLLVEAARPVEALGVIDALPEPENPRTRVELAAAKAVSLFYVGRFDEAIALSRASAVEHAALPGWLSRRGIAQHLVNEAHALCYAGRYRQVRALLEPAAEQARAHNALAAWVWFEMVLAENARDSGRAREAISRFGAAADAAASAGQEAALVYAHVGVARGHLLLGECAAASAALARADAIGYSPLAGSVTVRQQAEAWLEACNGDLAAARERIREALDGNRASQVLIYDAAMLNDLARFGAADEAIGRLRDLAEVVEGPLVGIYRDYAVATVDGDPDLLGNVVDRYEQLDALGHAAEAAAQLAELHRQRGDGRRAAVAGQRAVELATRAGGIATPVIARGSGVEPLTSREREIALMAAAGRTSRAIATRLHLSTRTVDTHLARVYRKLGIASRSEIGPALGPTSATNNGQR